MRRPLYKCSKCQGIVRRESEKQWIKSYCVRTDGYARLIRQATPEEPRQRRRTKEAQ